MIYIRQEMKMKPFKKLLLLFGSLTNIAIICGVTPQSVFRWGREKIPEARAKEIANKLAGLEGDEWKKKLPEKVIEHIENILQTPEFNGKLTWQELCPEIARKLSNERD